MAEYNKTYSRINWENEPSKKTALSATNLNRIDLGLNVVDDRVIELNTIKAEKSVVNNLVKDVSFTPETGVFQIIKQDGSTITYDTKLEKIAVNFTYDPLTQKLIIVLDDGTKQEVDLSTLVADYEFVDTDTVGFTKQPDGKISASVKNGSITEEKLQPNYLSEIKQQVNSSTQNVIQSENFANQSKRWAIGIDEEPSSLTDNSKYYSEEAKRYAEQAESTVGFGIATTEKAGIVKPDGVTITVAEDGTISGANKVDIATSSTVGVVKPSQDLTIIPDGTLGINTLFSMIEERANIQSGDTWETVLAKINKNLGDLKPLAFLDKVTESYLDTLIANKINNAIQKSQIVNNTVTEVEGTVLDGRVGKNLQDQIVEQNNNLENKIDLNNTGFFIGGTKHFAFLQIKQEQNVTRLQIESNEAKICKSTDGAISFPYCERLLTIQDKPIFQMFIFNPNGSTDIEFTLAHNAQTHTVYASNGDIDAYTGFVIGTQLVNNTNKLRILLSKQHWGNIRIQVMYMKS